MIEQLSVLRDELSMVQYNFGLSKEQVQFLEMMKDQRFNDVTGEMIGEI